MIQSREEINDYFLCSELFVSGKVEKKTMCVCVWGGGFPGVVSIESLNKKK